MQAPEALTAAGAARILSAMWETITQHYGSQTRAAKAIGLGQTTVSKAIRTGRPPPAEWARAWYEESDGALALHEMRPDLWDAPSRRRGRAA